MKKLIIPLLFIASLCPAATLIVTNLQLPAAYVAANSTNTTAGVTFTNSIFAPDDVRLYFQFNGVAASTNGSIISFVSLSADGTNWDTPLNSNVKLTFASSTTLPGISTNQISDWFHVTGANYFRIGRIENNSAGYITNMTFQLAYPEKR